MNVPVFRTTHHRSMRGRRHLPDLGVSTSTHSSFTPPGSMGRRVVDLPGREVGNRDREPEGTLERNQGGRRDGKTTERGVEFVWTGETRSVRLSREGKGDGGR